MYRCIFLDAVTANGQEWCKPSNWSENDKPVFYHGFDVTTNLMFYNMATRTTGLVRNSIATFFRDYRIMTA